MMELEKADQSRALVKHSGKQDKIAVGLGGIGLLTFALHLGGPVVWLAAAIGALLLSWESVTSSEKRTALATAAFALGVVPFAWEAVGLVTGILAITLKLAILAALVGGAYFGVRALSGHKKDPDAEEDAA